MSLSWARLAGSRFGVASGADRFRLSLVDIVVERCSAERQHTLNVKCCYGEMKAEAILEDVRYRHAARRDAEVSATPWLYPAAQLAASVMQKALLRLVRVILL